MKILTKIIVVLAMVVVLGAWGSCFSAELHVPSQYPTIQAAIAAAVKGDVVIVADGVYTGMGNRNINFRNKAITVRSENGPANCIIDCEQQGRGFEFIYGEGPACVLNGFTITNGKVSFGGGIECNKSSPTITNCIIQGNEASIAGGGIDCWSSSAIINNCVITRNWADGGGGGLTCVGGSPVIINSTITNNTSQRDTGGGILSFWSSIPKITNCILWGNKDKSGTGQSAQMSGIGRTVNYCRVQGWTGSLGGTGNTGEDPALAEDGYHLEPHSPCIDEGDPAYAAPSGAKDIDSEARIMGAGVDIGADEFTGTLALPVRLEISGPDAVAENSSVSFAAICNFDNGKARNITPVAVWRVEPAWAGSIDGYGVLHTGWIKTPIEYITIHGKYNFGGVTVEDETTILVSLPVSIEITGLENVWGSQPIQYKAVVSYDNGHTNNVTSRALWRVEPNSVGSIINSKGLLSLSQMEQPGQNIIVYAQHTSAGVTVHDGLEVGVSLPVGLEITGPNEAGSDCAVQYQAQVYYDNNQSEIVTNAASWRAEPNTLASIEDGLLQTSEANEPYAITVSSEYKVAGITVKSDKVVKVVQNPTIYVPSEFQTMQGAINSLQCGGTIIVADGVYRGEGNKEIDFQGKVIKLRSENGPENCIIDCENVGAGFYLYRDEDRNSVIDGFTIKRGEWIGIYCDRSSPTINNCIITENRLEGGISCYESRAVISNCVIKKNQGIFEGAVNFYGGSPEIINCIIASNNTRWDYGGGISCYGTDAHINGCTIIGNTGNGIWRDYYDDEGQPHVTNCIVRGNTESQMEGNIDVTYSNIEGGWENGGEPAQQDEDAWEGEGNIDADPCFAFAGDYHVMAGSASIDAGDPNYLAEPNETDIEGKDRVLSGRIDMGAYEHDPNHPSIAISTRELSFRCAEGSPEPDAQNLSIRNCGAGILNWVITSDCNWIEVEPTNGSSTGKIIEVSLTVDCIGIERGTYSCMLTISDSDATNSPVKVQVVLHVEGVLRVPNSYPTIQAAIDAAADGDTVIVADGVYTGEGNRDIDFQGKAITVRSENGPENCIIDCEQHCGVYFTNNEGATSVLDGFTITKGHGSYSGGGIVCSKSSPTIANCIITFNSAVHGSGISSRWAYPTIKHCIISNNKSSQDGAIFCSEGNMTISSSIISGNQTSHGGGISVSHGGLAVNNCTITGNIATTYGGGMRCTCGGTATLTNCIVWGNESPHGPQMLVSSCYGGSAPSHVYINHSNVQGGRVGIDVHPSSTANWGSGNIVTDPCFVKAGYWDANGTADEPWDDFWVEGDYRPRRKSPCVDAGTDVGVYTDIEGKNRPFDFPGVDNNGDKPEFDMGAYELTPVEAQVSFTPKVLNCRSKGKWVKAHIVLPDGISVEDIDVNAPAVVVPFGVESQYIKVAGHNPAQVEIGFDRQAICASAGKAGEIEAAVIGSLTDGRYFAGTDKVQVKN